MGVVSDCSVPAVTHYALYYVYLCVSWNVLDSQNFFCLPCLAVQNRHILSSTDDLMISGRKV